MTADDRLASLITRLKQSVDVIDRNLLYPVGQHPVGWRDLVSVVKELQELAALLTDDPSRPHPDEHPPIHPDEAGDWKAANEGIGARIQTMERTKDVMDSLHAVFTRNGIASYTDYPHLAGDIVHWACEMYRQHESLRASRPHEAPK